MKKAMVLLILSIFLIGCEHITTDIHDSGNNVYDLVVYLDTVNDSLIVYGELYYRNLDHDLDELYLILYPNADNPRGTGTNAVFEYFKVDGVETGFEVEGEDDTQIHVVLPETLQKGERVSLAFKYEFLYWDDDRILAAGGYYLTMFFYPYVAMYDGSSWSMEPYSFMGETYYNEIGDYYVSISAPNEYEIAASGALVNSKSQGSRTVRNYEIKNARDFSFCASQYYHVYEYSALGVDFEIYSIRELTQMEVDNSFGYLETAMEMLERDIGDYPYDHFTLEYGNFYGMESSGVIYCSQEIAEGTVVHELIHQWFYSMVGNDQAHESFVDEALTTYATSFYYYELYGSNGYDGYLDYRTSLKPEFTERYQANLGVSLLREVDEYGEYYGFLIYYHGPAMFRYYVEEFLDGDIQKMKDILKVYFEEYNLGVATLDDLLDLLEEESGVDITKDWFYLQLNEFQDFDNRP